MVALGATLDIMARQAAKSERVFKTAWFTKAARKAYITDEELCSAIRQVMVGQADDLGGRGVQEATEEESIPFHHRRQGKPVLGLRLSVRKAGSGQYRGR